jgi:hypothetical protein
LQADGLQKSNSLQPVNSFTAAPGDALDNRAFSREPKRKKTMSDAPATPLSMTAALCRFALVVLLALAAARAGHAAGAAEAHSGQSAHIADTQRLARFRLDKPTLSKVEAAVTNMALALKQQPQLAKDGAEDRGDTIAEIASFYDSKPPLKKAIESAGLTCDGFTLAMMALLQAGMAQGLAQSLPPERRARAIADAGVPAANVAFVEAHQDSIARVGLKMKTLQGKD